MLGANIGLWSGYVFFFPPFSLCDHPCVYASITWSSLSIHEFMWSSPCLGFYYLLPPLSPCEFMWISPCLCLYYLQYFMLHHCSSLGVMRCCCISDIRTLPWCLLGILRKLTLHEEVQCHYILLHPFNWKRVHLAFILTLPQRWHVSHGFCLYSSLYFCLEFLQQNIQNLFWM